MLNISQNTETRTLIPVADISENEDYYLISLEIPGVNRENLEIIINDDKLTVTGKIQSGKNEDNFKYVEFKKSDYERTFQIGNEIDRNKIEAKLENGILELKLSKSENIKPKKITVNEIH